MAEVRTALVRDSDGLVVNVIFIDFDPPASPYVGPPPPFPQGHTLISAQHADGSWRRVGPGCRYVGGAFYRPVIEAPTQLAVGQQGTVTLRWVDEADQPVPYQQPITLEVMGQRQSYTPGADGSVSVPFSASVAGTYMLQVVEVVDPVTGAVAVPAHAVVTVQ